MDRRRRPGILTSLVAAVEASAVRDALVWTGGNESAASRLLGTTRTTVRKVRAVLPELPPRDEYVYSTAPEGAPWVSAVLEPQEATP